MIALVVGFQSQPFPTREHFSFAITVTFIKIIEIQHVACFFVSQNRFYFYSISYVRGSKNMHADMFFFVTVRSAESLVLILIIS